MNSEGYVRRIFDLILLLTMLPLVITAICTVSIFSVTGGPVLYKSERVGRLGKPFVIYKLRTMTVDAPCLPTASSSVAGYVLALVEFCGYLVWMNSHKSLIFSMEV